MAMNEASSGAQVGLSSGGHYVLAESDGRPSAEEGRRLMLAFMNIRRPAQREALLNLVAKLSGRGGGPGRTTQ
jgi:hypothetical protein